MNVATPGISWSALVVPIIQVPRSQGQACTPDTTDAVSRPLSSRRQTPQAVVVGRRRTCSSLHRVWIPPHSLRLVQVRSPQTPRIVGRFASLAGLQERIGPFRLDRVECCVLASARADCVTQLRVASSHQRGQRLPLHPDSLRRRSSRSGTPGRDHLVLGVATSNVGAVSAVVHSLAGDRGEQNTSVHNRTKETHRENLRNKPYVSSVCVRHWGYSERSGQNSWSRYVRLR